MIELSVVGTKNSGKTTLIEKLLPLIKSTGLQVATVKHTSHNHAFDTPGKDSHRHRMAGSELTMAVSSTELALFAPNDSRIIKKLRDVISQHADLCLIEGDKSSDRAKLLVTINDSNTPDPLPNNIVATCGSISVSDNVPHFTSDNLTDLADYVINLCSIANGKAASND